MAPPDVPSMRERVSTLLRCLGEDTGREGLANTPNRVAKAVLAVTAGHSATPASVVGDAVFNEPSVAQGGAGLVIVKDVDFCSTRDSDLLPFYGRCHIGYVPSGGRVLGLSKLVRLVKLYSKRLQCQHRLTAQVAQALTDAVGAAGAIVLVNAKHLSHADPVTVQTTCAGTGVCSSDPAVYQEFLSLLRLAGVPCPSPPHRPHPEYAVPAPRTPGCSSTDLEGDEDSRASTSDVEFMDDTDSCGCASALPLTDGPSSAAVTLGVPPPRRRNPPPPDARSTVRLKMCDCATALLREALQEQCPPGVRACAEGYVDALLSATRGYRVSLEAIRGGPPPEAAACAPQPGSSETCRPHPDLGCVEHCFTFTSQCEHHMLPFHGQLRLVVAGGGAWTDGQLAAIVGMYTKRLQVQERITHQVADAVASCSGVAGVLALVESTHMCMVARGIESHASSTTTLAARGVYEADAARRAELLERLAASANTISCGRSRLAEF